MLDTRSDRLLSHSTNYPTTSTLQDLETSKNVLYSWYTYVLCSWYTRKQVESSNEPPKLRKQARPWHIRVYACTNTSCTYHLRSPAPTDSTSTTKFDSDTNGPRASIFTKHQYRLLPRCRLRLCFAKYDSVSTWQLFGSIKNLHRSKTTSS
jgi:hypothetical protein